MSVRRIVAEEFFSVFNGPREEERAFLRLLAFSRPGKFDLSETQAMKPAQIRNR